MDPPPAYPTFYQALRVWVRIGLLSFGGPAGQISLMHRELVENRRWISDKRFLHALNYCMLLPGPEAQQLAIYTGWLLHRTRGGIVAGALFVLPGALLMLGISYVYVTFGKLPWMESIFYGLKAAVMAVVISAVMRIGKKVLNHPLLWALSAMSFVAIFFFSVPFPLIIVSALMIGWLLGRYHPDAFRMAGGHGEKAGELSGTYVISDAVSENIPTLSWPRTLGRISFWLLLWMAPVVASHAILGASHVLSREGVFFSKAALVTFGGAYAVLPYVAQQAVEGHGWLSAEQMMDGLGLAETTPGPLILVLQFVGFLGGWNAESGMPPLLAAVLCAGITTWCTFIPGFLFIFAGAPFVERSRGDLRFQSALTAMTAAVVGVIFNLAVWFA
nr:chromate efflux transporter [Akkermansiaceae bacterium]